MIDTFALAITHVLIGLTVWRLVMRADLDGDIAPAPEQPEAPPRA